MKRIIKKVKTRLNDTLRTIIKYNYYLKPSGIYYSSKDFVNLTTYKDSAYVEIYPDLTTSLPIPEQLFNALSSFSTYDMHSSNKDNTLLAKNNYALVQIPAGRLYSNNKDCIAVISTDNKLIADVSFQYNTNRQTQPHENKIFELSYFDTPTYLKGTAFSMLAGGGAVHNYGHWLLDSFSRLHLLKESGLFETVDWFIVPNNAFDYQRDSLKAMGIEADKIITAYNHMHIKADKLIATSHPRGMRSVLVPDWIPVFYRNAFLNQELPSNKYPSKIYISRRDSKLRIVTNEDQLLEKLQPLGFQSFELSKLTFLEKIQLFASADIIVSASGAGLSNLLFAKKGAKLIEVFSESFVHSIYYNIARSIGLQYDFVICKSEKKATNMRQGLTDDITVDIPEVLERLEKFAISEAIIK